MAFKFNPFTGNFDIDTGTGAGGDTVIQQYSSDPASPATETAWVLRTGGGGNEGEPIGLLLAFTEPGGASTYQLSYRTLQSTTIRVSLL